MGSVYHLTIVRALLVIQEVIVNHRYATERTLQTILYAQAMGLVTLQIAAIARKIMWEPIASLQCVLE